MTLVIGCKENELFVLLSWCLYIYKMHICILKMNEILRIKHFEVFSQYRSKLETQNNRIFINCFMIFLLMLIINEVCDELDIHTYKKKKLATRQFRNLIEYFKCYFAHMGSSWIQNLFLLPKDNKNLAKILQNKLLKLAANEGFKMNYFRLELISILSMLKLLYISLFHFCQHNATLVCLL